MQESFQEEPEDPDGDDEDTDNRDPGDEGYSEGCYYNEDQMVEGRNSRPSKFLQMESQMSFEQGNHDLQHATFMKNNCMAKQEKDNEMFQQTQKVKKDHFAAAKLMK